VKRLDREELLARRAEFVIIDVRDRASFDQGHIEGSGSLTIPEFRSRRAELPPRESRMLVVAEQVAQAEGGAAELETLAFADVHFLTDSVSSLGSYAGSREAPARLWRPARFLEEVLPQVPRGRAADLAAGSGREAVFLAENGFEVEAWDAAPEALERAKALAARSGIAITTVLNDLEAPGLELPPARYDLVVCFRFLHRPLFPKIARALAPGGHLVYETFRVGQERFGKPKRREFLLEPGELRRAFAMLEVLSYEESDGESAPVIARLHARR